MTTGDAIRTRDNGTGSGRTRGGHRRPPAAECGVEGNERLTALTGTVLLAGFAAEGVTILALGRLHTPQLERREQTSSTTVHHNLRSDIADQGGREDEVP